ncbi:MAG: clostripain-related cysteine peptidase [Chloroflexota bacterium]
MHSLQRLSLLLIFALSLSWLPTHSSEVSYAGSLSTSSESTTPRETQQAANLIPLSNVIQIDARWEHACALVDPDGDGKGTVHCWGRNDKGQLGDGTITPRSRPVAVDGLEHTIAITAGHSHTCALREDNNGTRQVLCWGNNSQGQLGDGTQNASRSPKVLEQLPDNIETISAGHGYTCAITRDGALYCWGENGYGKLGTGNTDNSYTPILVKNMEAGVADVDTSAYHTCALMRDDGLRCWGRERNGILGYPPAAEDINHTSINEPVEVVGMGTQNQQIALGEDHTCAINSVGALYCWGENSYGRLGNGGSSNTFTPTLVHGFSSGVTDVTLGGQLTCAVRNKRVHCWGQNLHGQNGDGTTTISTAPVPIQGLDLDIRDVTSGRHFGCALAEVGTVYCWGENVNGQLGDGTSVFETTPSLVVPSDFESLNFVQLDSGNFHTCGLTDSGAVYCWGRNNAGQIGDGTFEHRTTPTQVEGLSSGALKVVAGDLHSCAINRGRAAVCWGYNYDWQLGDGLPSTEPGINSTVPIPVSGLNNNIQDIAAGASHTCVLTDNGEVSCWGYNFHGMGDGTENDQYRTPIRIDGLGEGVLAIAAGQYHTCVLDAQREVLCWGGNNGGELGVGTQWDTQRSPQKVQRLDSGVQALAASVANTCVISHDNKLYCWGGGQYGQNGDGTAENRFFPSLVGRLDNVTDLAMMDWSVCAVGQSKLTCWGYNHLGQLGIGSAAEFTTRPSTYLNLTDITALNGGSRHACAVSQGKTYCWGDNEFGQLGNGRTLISTTPTNVQVTGEPPDEQSPSLVPLTNVIQISTGEDHACAVVDTDGDGMGNAYCWGYNEVGQLGDGTQIHSSLPVQVMNLDNVMAVVAGVANSCAITLEENNKRQVWCWGNGYQGAIGHGSYANSFVPTPVVDLPDDVNAISAGQNYACAATESGALYCWGRNEYNQLGNDIADEVLAPQLVEGLTSVVDMETSHNHTCALLQDDSLRCWGREIHGALGRPHTETTTNHSSTPQPGPVEGLNAPIQKMSLGDFYTCAITEAGALYCWGSNSAGQLGNGGNVTGPTPKQIYSFDSGTTDVTGGHSHTCAIKDEDVYCWGTNNHSQHGNGPGLNGTFFDSTIPVLVDALTDKEVVDVEAGYDYTCALTQGGQVYCWGQNRKGQSGMGTPLYQLSPRPLAMPSGAFHFREIDTGLFHACGLTDAGSVYCWGYNNEGQLGNGSTRDSSTPVLVTGLESGAKKVVVGKHHSCAINQADTAVCWGWNYNGQVDSGLTGTEIGGIKSVPTQVIGLPEGVTDMAAGTHHTCATTIAGELFCWGASQTGQLGIGTTDRQTAPVQVQSLGTGVSSIVASNSHTCALDNQGKAFCWGSNYIGQLGDGSQETRLSPTPVSRLGNGNQAIFTSDSSTCAVDNAGQLYCWGNNRQGQLGTGSFGWLLEPNQVEGLANVRDVALMEGSTCAIDGQNQLYCWGQNDLGQLGIGTQTDYKLRPVAVPDMGNVSYINGGGEHACAITDTDSFCWGEDLFGQLGGGRQLVTKTPRAVLTESGCLTLTPQSSQGGALPELEPAGSPGCTTGMYVPGESISLSARPDEGWSLSGWTGTDDDATVNPEARLTMPDAEHTVTVRYSQNCYRLTLSQSVQRSAPVASPAHSAICEASHYIAGEAITLQASPAAGWFVDGWEVTADGERVAIGDAFVMPASDAIALVRYNEVLTPIPALDADCAGITPEGDYNPTVCLVGMVYVDGAPVADADVVITKNGRPIAPVSTRRHAGSESRPHYKIRLSESSPTIQAGEAYSVKATYNGQSVVIQRWANEGHQQVDLVFGSTTYTRPIATIQRIAISSLQRSDTLDAEGLGHHPKGNDTNLRYEWHSDKSGLLGTSYALSKPASELEPGDHQLSFRVQDEQGTWSRPTVSTIFVNGPKQAQWTLLLYLAGDYPDEGRLLRRFERAIGKLKEKVDTTSIRIAALVDGPGDRDTYRVTITPGVNGEAPDFQRDNTIGEKAMDDPATLTEFLNWSQIHFGKQKSYLVIANHGQGARGIAWDATSDKTDDALPNNRSAFLSTVEVAQAIGESDVGSVEILHFDACSMNLLEAAYELQEEANILIASQYLGWDYFHYDLYEDAIDPVASPQHIARSIVNLYGSWAESDGVPFTISAIDLKALQPAMKTLDELATGLVDEKSSGRLGLIELYAIREQSQKFESDGDLKISHKDVYIDLRDWATQLAKTIDNQRLMELATELAEQLAPGHSLVIDSHRGNGILTSANEGATLLERANGLSIYYPKIDRPVDRHSLPRTYQKYIGHQLFPSFTQNSPGWLLFLDLHPTILPPGLNEGTLLLPPPELQPLAPQAVPESTATPTSTPEPTPTQTATPEPAQTPTPGPTQNPQLPVGPTPVPTHNSKLFLPFVKG